MHGSLLFATAVQCSPVHSKQRRTVDSIDSFRDCKEIFTETEKNSQVTQGFSNSKTLFLFACNSFSGLKFDLKKVTVISGLK